MQIRHHAYLLENNMPNEKLNLQCIKQSIISLWKRQVIENHEWPLHTMLGHGTPSASTSDNLDDELVNAHNLVVPGFWGRRSRGGYLYLRCHSTWVICCLGLCFCGRDCLSIGGLFLPCRGNAAGFSRHWWCCLFSMIYWVLGFTLNALIDWIYLVLHAKATNVLLTLLTLIPLLLYILYLVQYYLH